MTMKFVTVLILILFFSCATREACNDFKTGKFVYVDDSMPERIERNDSMQIEINPKTGVAVYSSIDWIDDCQYVLTFTKILNHKNDVSYMIGKKIYVEVYKANKNKYSAYIKMDDNRQILEFEKVGD